MASWSGGFYDGFGNRVDDWGFGFDHSAGVLGEDGQGKDERAVPHGLPMGMQSGNIPAWVRRQDAGCIVHPLGIKMLVCGLLLVLFTVLDVVLYFSVKGENIALHRYLMLSNVNRWLWTVSWVGFVMMVTIDIFRIMIFG